METFGIIFFCAWIVVMLFFIYMIFRIKWTAKNRHDWNNKVYGYRKNLINKSDFETFDKFSYDEMLESLAGFNEMQWRFWCWEINKFVKDRELYETIIYGDASRC